MSAVLIMAATTTPSGEATPRPEIDPASVTPGLEGFLATLFVVVLVIFLIRDMVKRIRRVRYAGEVQQAREQQRPATFDADPPAAGREARSGDDGTGVRSGSGGEPDPDER